MMEPRLQNQFGAMQSMLRRARLWRQLAFCWAGTAGAELLVFLIHGVTGWNTRLLWWLVLASGLTAACIVWKRERRRPVDFGALVAAIERENPELRLLLATAVEQEPDPHSRGFGFLQMRVI